MSAYFVKTPDGYEVFKVEKATSIATVKTPGEADRIVQLAGPVNAPLSVGARAARTATAGTSTKKGVKRRKRRSKAEMEAAQAVASPAAELESPPEDDAAKVERLAAIMKTKDS